MDSPQQPTPRVTTKPDILDLQATQYTSRQDVLDGINADPPYLPDQLLWNAKGLQHFEAITRSPDYYLTGCEMALLQQYSSAIAERVDQDSVLLELGSGCLDKTKVLLDALEALGRDVDYYALDLSMPELERTLSDPKLMSYHHVKIHGLVGTYEAARIWLGRLETITRPKCVMFLGSTIGNFTRLDAAHFLHQFSTMARKTTILNQKQPSFRFIIGVDGFTDRARVCSAYQDAAGLNKDFILNALDHANQKFDNPVFDPKDWTVQGVWDAEDVVHRQYLIPLRDLEFKGRQLSKGQKVFVVASHKYNLFARLELRRNSRLDVVLPCNNQHGSPWSGYAIEVLQVRMGL